MTAATRRRAGDRYTVKLGIGSRVVGEAVHYTPTPDAPLRTVSGTVWSAAPTRGQWWLLPDGETDTGDLPASSGCVLVRRIESIAAYAGGAA